MSYKHVATAGDLVRFGCSLKVECTACGAARTLNGVEVHHMHGNAQIAQLAPRLRSAQLCRGHSEHWRAAAAARKPPS